MKLSPRDAQAFFQKPPADAPGALIFGADPMRVAHKRQQLLSALLGPNAEEEMRLTRIAGAELRKDPALLLDAVQSVGFFPGARVVFVSEASDLHAPPVAASLQQWRPGDAQVVVTAGQLKPNSKLRKLFEGHPHARSIAIYDDPPTRTEIEREIAGAGIGNPSSAALSSLYALASELSPGDFRQLLDKISLYKRGDASELTVEEIELCAPLSVEAGIDDVLAIVAEARKGEIGQVMQRLQDQGITAVALIVAATRHFRTLYRIAAHPDGPAAGIGQLRPPAFGKRRDQLLRQAQKWGPNKLESGLTMLTDTDLQLRSAGQNAPAMALVERTLIRLAMLAHR